MKMSSFVVVIDKVIISIAVQSEFFYAKCRCVNKTSYSVLNRVFRTVGPALIAVKEHFLSWRNFNYGRNIVKSSLKINLDQVYLLQL